VPLSFAFSSPANGKVLGRRNYEPLLGLPVLFQLGEDLGLHGGTEAGKLTELAGFGSLDELFERGDPMRFVPRVTRFCPSPGIEVRAESVEGVRLDLIEGSAAAGHQDFLNLARQVRTIAPARNNARGTLGQVLDGRGGPTMGAHPKWIRRPRSPKKVGEAIEHTRNVGTVNDLLAQLRGESASVVDSDQWLAANRRFDAGQGPGRSVWTSC